MYYEESSISSRDSGKEIGNKCMENQGNRNIRQLLIQRPKIVEQEK